MSSGMVKVKDGEWEKVRRNFQRIGSTVLGVSASPTFAGLTLTGLTASRLIWTNSVKALASKDLVDLVAGTANRVIRTDDSAGGVVLTLPQDFHTGALITLAGLTLTNACVLASNSVVFQPATDARNWFKILDDTDVVIVSVDGLNRRVGFRTDTPLGTIDARQDADGVANIAYYSKRSSDSGGGAGYFVKFTDVGGDNNQFAVDTVGNVTSGSLLIGAGGAGSGSINPDYYLEAGDKTTALQTTGYTFQQYASTGGAIDFFKVDLKRDTAGDGGYNALLVDVLEDVSPHANNFLLHLKQSATTRLSVHSGGNIVATGKIVVGSQASPIDVTNTRQYGIECHYSGNNYDVTGIRARAQLVTTDASTRTAIGGLFQAANNDNIDAGVLMGFMAEAIGKSTVNATTITTMRGGLVGTEWGAKDTVTNLKTLHVRGHSLNAAGAGSFGTGYALYIENEAVGGNGQAYDAGIYFKGTTLSAGNKAFTHGIDFTGGTYGTAEIKLSNSETIDNLIDGTITLSGKLESTNYSAANKLTACTTNAGVLDFSAASKTLTVENNAIVSQDYSADGTPTLGGLTVTNCAVLGSDSAVFQPNADAVDFFRVNDEDGNAMAFVDTINNRLTLAGDLLVPDDCGIRSLGIGNSGAVVIQENDGTHLLRMLNFTAAWDDDTESSFFQLGLDYGLFTATGGGSFTRFSINTQGMLLTNESYLTMAAPETMLDIRNSKPYVTTTNRSVEDKDGGGESRWIGNRYDGAGTKTAAGQIEISHDGVGANDQLGKIVLGVNTGAGVVDALTIDSARNIIAEQGVFSMSETTTPTAIANNGALYTTSDNELFFQDGAGTEHLLHGDSFSNIWYHGISTVEVAIAAQNAFAIITSFTVVGHEDDLLNLVGSSANNNLTLSSIAGGEYEISYHGSITATGGADKVMMFALGITLATPKDITNVTDDTVTPIVITSVAHGLENGDMVQIAGVLVNLAANGSFIVDSKTNDTFEIVKLDGSATTGNGDYDEGTPTGDVIIEYPGDMVIKRAVRGADLSAISATGLHILANSDVLALYIANISGATNLTVDAVSLDANRIGD